MDENVRYPQAAWTRAPGVMELTDRKITKYLKEGRYGETCGECGCRAGYYAVKIDGVVYHQRCVPKLGEQQDRGNY